MALTDNKSREIQRPDLSIPTNINAKGTIKFFRGAIIVNNAGEADNAPVTGALPFLGFARAFLDLTGLASQTNKDFQIEKGAIEKMVMDVAPSETDIGKKVYYVADDKVSLTIVVTTGVPESQVGVLHEIETAGGVDVFIDTSKAIT